MNLSFENKVALVTGAGSGMGLTTARAFAEAGAAVALADLNESAVRSAAEELVSAGHKAIGVHCDVADEAGVAAMVEQTITTFGRLDAAFNNAGIQSPVAETADASGEDFERVNAVNLRGVWNCMKSNCADAGARKWRDRQQLFDWRARGHSRPGRLSRRQTWGDWAHQKCGSRIRRRGIASTRSARGSSKHQWFRAC